MRHTDTHTRSTKAAVKELGSVFSECYLGAEDDGEGEEEATG